MKVNIRSLQSGGPALPFVDYMPFTGVAGADTSTGGAGDSASSSKSKSGGSNDIGLKDILGLVKEMNVLPSDAEKIIRNIRSMYQEQNLFNNGQLSADQIMTTYLSALKGLNDAKYNVDQAKKIRDNLMSEGSLHDIAIKDDGKLIVQDTQNGGIHYLTVDQFNYLNKQNPGKFEALTNANLLDYRANDGQFAFKNDILRLASNGISEKTVTEMLQRALKDIGATTLKQEGYSEKAGRKIIGGLEQLQEAFSDGMDIDGVYKQSYLNKEQKEQIDAAMAYIWRSMPNNARTWLKFKSGDTDNSEAGAKKLMASLMFAHNSPTIEYNLQRVGAGNGDGSGVGSTDEDKMKESFLTQVQKSEAGVDATWRLNLGYDKNSGKDFSNTVMDIKGKAYSIIPDTSGKPIADTDMYTMLSESGILGISKGLNSIYFGEQKLTEAQLRNVAYTGGGAIRVNMPKTSDGQPDFELYKLFNDFQDELKLKGNTKENRDQLLAGKYSKLVGLIKPNGEINTDRFMPMLLVRGITTDNLAGVKKENLYVNEMKPDPQNYALIKEALAKGTGKDKQYPDIDEYGFSEAIMPEWLNGYDKIYKGMIFIPLDENQNNAHMYSGQHLSTSQSDKLELDYQNREMYRKDYNPTSGSDLLNN